MQTHKHTRMTWFCGEHALKIYWVCITDPEFIGHGILQLTPNSPPSNQCRRDGLQSPRPGDVALHCIYTHQRHQSSMKIEALLRVTRFGPQVYIIATRLLTQHLHMCNFLDNRSNIATSSVHKAYIQLHKVFSMLPWRFHHPDRNQQPETATTLVILEDVVC